MSSTGELRSTAAVGTHSSISTWALMPPKPKPLTAARRGRPVAGLGQGSARVRTRNGPDSNPSSGAASSKWAVGGSSRCPSAKSTLSNPAAPAAVSVWPMFDLIEPNTHWPLRQLLPLQREFKLLSSTASPIGVPVAWHSIRSTSHGAPAGLGIGGPHRAELPFGAGRHQVAVDVVG